MRTVNLMIWAGEMIVLQGITEKNENVSPREKAKGNHLKYFNN